MPATHDCLPLSHIRQAFLDEAATINALRILLEKGLVTECPSSDVLHPDAGRPAPSPGGIAEPESLIPHAKTRGVPLPVEGDCEYGLLDATLCGMSVSCNSRCLES